VDKLLTNEDLAERYNVSKGTVYGWSYKGSGPPRLKLGKHDRYRESDVERWEEEHLVDRDDLRQDGDRRGSLSSSRVTADSTPVPGTSSESTVRGRPKTRGAARIRTAQKRAS
jgi:predicted DNA-binding transcriptional regulator AlpA